LLARITYGLVGLALATLIAGFFQKSSNALLYVSIVLSVLAIVLVVIGAARRAREVPAAEVEFEPAFEEAGSTTLEDEIPADLLSPFDEEEEEEEEEEELEIIPTRRTTTRTSTRTTTRKPAAAAKSPAKTKARADSAAGKVIVVPGRDRYHTPACRFIQGKTGTEEVTAATAKRRGYQPCSACKPG
jgi:hypothetical protein